MGIIIYYLGKIYLQWVEEVILWVYAYLQLIHNLDSFQQDRLLLNTILNYLIKSEQ